jgi:hypothetical protein
MSFLSSHRLHWGVHHELSDNFWVHLNKMVHGPMNASTPADGPGSAPAGEGVSLTGGLTSPVESSPEALGP